MDNSTSTVNNDILILKVDFEAVKNPFIVTVYILFACFLRVLLQVKSVLFKFGMPESCIFIVVGFVISQISRWANEPEIHLSPQVFLLFLLPTVILDASITTPINIFFQNLGSILTLAIVNTIFSILTIGSMIYLFAEIDLIPMNISYVVALMFSTIVAAVDPVAVLSVFQEIGISEGLQILIFGESLMNDAVTIAFFRAFSTMSQLDEVTGLIVGKCLLSLIVVLFGGVFMGLILGIITAFITKFSSKFPKSDPIIFIGMAYFSYLVTEIFHLSSVLGLYFYGLVMKKYASKNLNYDSFETIDYIVHLSSEIAEAIIFVLLGSSANNLFNDVIFSTEFIFFNILFCIIFRAIGLLIFLHLLNYFRIQHFTLMDLFILTYGGLRGGIAYGLAVSIPDNIENKLIFEDATIVLIIFTMFLQGMSLKPLTKILKIKGNALSNDTPKICDMILSQGVNFASEGIASIVTENNNKTIMRFLINFDDYYLSPFLIQNFNKYSADSEIVEAFDRLILEEVKNDRKTLELLKKGDPYFFKLAKQSIFKTKEMDYLKNVVSYALKVAKTERRRTFANKFYDTNNILRKKSQMVTPFYGRPSFYMCP